MKSSASEPGLTDGRLILTAKVAKTKWLEQLSIKQIDNSFYCKILGIV